MTEAPNEDDRGEDSVRLDAAVVRAWARLLRAGQSLLAAVEGDLKAAGFPPLSWYDVLLELERSDEGALRPYQLEERMLLAQYNLSRLLDRLERAGYVVRRPCPDDRRGQIVVLTDDGRALRRRMWPAYAAAIERHFGAHFRPVEADRLAELLGRLLPGR